MAKIQKIELNLGQKIANPFKTTRKSSTNPFENKNFEGNTIDPLICADVLVSFKGKENKLKMIASSVMGSMTKMRKGITEPIINFVNRVRENITLGITNAAEKIGLKNLSENINSTKEYIHNILNYDVGKGISDSLSGLGKNITGRLNGIHEDITGLGKDLSEKWTALIGKIHTNKISSNLSVAELRDLWIKENELIKEAA